MGGLWTEKWPPVGFVFTVPPSLLLPVAHHWGGKRGQEA